MGWDWIPETAIAKKRRSSMRCTRPRAKRTQP